MNDLLLLKALKDTLDPRMIALSVLPLLIGILFWGVLFLSFGESLYNALALPIEGYFSGVEGGFFGSVLNFFIGVLVYLFIFALFLLAVVITNALLATFYAPLVAKFLQKKYYPNVMIEGFGGIWDSVLFFLKTIFLFLLLLLLMTPFYFIPLVGFLVPIVIFFWFFRKNIIFDVGSTLLSKEEYEDITSTFKGRINMNCLVAYLIGYIPVVNFFAGVFQLLLLTHLFFLLKKERAMRV